MALHLPVYGRPRNPKRASHGAYIPVLCLKHFQQCVFGVAMSVCRLVGALLGNALAQALFGQIVNGNFVTFRGGQGKRQRIFSWRILPGQA
ncbi:hypothetical protein HORIV_39660 [Vreelandella olivaria]|uniref:Uncharacterized protein n=1 Tax=Vreelandella olivaria TaxID=390919 RepID=A0ABN5X329_9GAMM|nr:hypothetical protein HORIV_39660 [Halomonas olivaria]